ncbi:hypothetical protein [Halothermothrix orenii]|uniref:Uncharacterized protein n=1 Tax=Halothermothrix orenii (strain H 168 / OCM 544 / DSM 9562) TaxID=373903 RepID=B8CWC5_HALOH|nr:hypothetical protein [Halothermothrix orenii]ACL69594.1 hypothetical protein Hore_08370 [Halothermothrix orenii H 168]
MLFIFMGASCTGKTSVANELNKTIQGDIYTGKDYLRFSRNSDEAWGKFKEKLIDVSTKDIDTSIIYVTNEIDHVNELSLIKDAIFIKFTADLETIKTRFSQRMNGNLPDPVAKMLERQSNDWKKVEVDFCLDTSSGVTVKESVNMIRDRFRI